MVKSFHPSRGKGKVKYKKEENPKPFDWGSEEVVEIDRTSSSASEKEEKPKSFDWDAASSSSGGKNPNSTLIFTLVPDIVIRTPPGSGMGIITDPAVISQPRKTQYRWYLLASTVY